MFFFTYGSSPLPDLAPPNCLQAELGYATSSQREPVPGLPVVVASDRSFQHPTCVLCSVCHNDMGILGVFGAEEPLSSSVSSSVT